MIVRFSWKNYTKKKKTLPHLKKKLEIVQRKQYYLETVAHECMKSSICVLDNEKTVNICYFFWFLFQDKNGFHRKQVSLSDKIKNW